MINRTYYKLFLILVVLVVWGSIYIMNRAYYTLFLTSIVLIWGLIYIINFIRLGEIKWYAIHIVRKEYPHLFTIVIILMCFGAIIVTSGLIMEIVGLLRGI